MPDRPAPRMGVRAAAPAAAFAAALLAGALLRAAVGGGLLSSTLVYSAPVKETPPGGGSPADAARSFYILLDRGEYAAAWGLAREPDCTGSGNAPYLSAVRGEAGALRGWTSREAFVSRLNDELGRGGEWLRLADIQTEEIGGAEAEVAAGTAPAGTRIAAVVRARGTLLGACTIFRWEKVLPVMRGGRSYQVLLPGTKQADGLYYQEWFAKVRKIGTLRGAVP